MNLSLLGVNHRTAPVEIRERFAIPESRLAEATDRLMHHPGVEEGMIVSTCNRVELLVSSSNGRIDLRAFLKEYFRTDLAPYEEHLYELNQREAVRHVFRVAASLDSMIVGEPQVLGQVKEAYAVARGVGAIHSNLNVVITRAFAVAKRVRHETQVGSSAVSVASVAVELAKKIFGSLEGKHVFLVGAGKMSELAARHLLAHGAGSIFVANRTHDRAVELAGRFQGEAIRFDQLYDTADRADIVISSTGAPHAIFRRDHGLQFLQRRKNRPMFFIDIAVPRDVDPEMNNVDGIFVYDIDDLQSVVASHLTDRKSEAERAEQIVEAEVDKCLARFSEQGIVPTIVSLQEQIETIRQAEIDRARGRLGVLTPDQEMAVDALTKAIVNKILHTPITTLKSAAREEASTTLEETIRRLFNLKAEDPKKDQPK
jgi:glutamyl-tRNA reductase